MPTAAVPATLRACQAWPSLTRRGLTHHPFPGSSSNLSRKKHLKHVDREGIVLKALKALSPGVERNSPLPQRRPIVVGTRHFVGGMPARCEKRGRHSAASNLAGDSNERLWTPDNRKEPNWNGSDWVGGLGHSFRPGRDRDSWRKEPGTTG